MQETIDKYIKRLEKEIESMKSFNIEHFYNRCEELGIDKFSWTQYSPYFNDGEACEFSVHEDMRDIYLSFDDEVYDDAYSMYDYIDGNEIYKSEKHKEASNFDWWDCLGLSEDVLHELFDNHVIVTVDVKNRKITTDEYYHD